MTEENRSHKKRNVVVMSVAGFLVFTVVGVLVLGGSWVYALSHLQFGFPNMYVTLDSKTLAFTITITLPISNPTDIGLPTMTMLFDFSLNDALLFRQQTVNIGTLGAHQTFVGKLDTTVNLLSVYVLYGALMDFCANKTVGYTYHCIVTAHLGTDVHMIDVTKQGTVNQ